MITTASLAGWVLFSVFGGVGLPALPFDMLMDYKYRPKRIKLQEYTDKKKMVGEQASLLLQASAALMEEKKKAGRAKNFQNSKQRAYKKKENEFKKVFDLSDCFDHLGCLILREPIQKIGGCLQEWWRKPTLLLRRITSRICWVSFRVSSPNCEDPSCLCFGSYTSVYTFYL
jgi:LMBR1 domain-containing protein 1